MPILNILLNKNCPSDQKTQLLEGVSQAVVDSISAPLKSVRVCVQTIDAGDVIVAGQVGKTMVQVDVYLLPGRTESQKVDLIAALSRTITDTVDISNQDIRIILHNVATTDMGVAGGISAKMAGR